MNLLKYRF